MTRLTADCKLLEKQATLLLDVDESTGRGIGKLNFRGGPLNLNQVLDTITSEVGAGNPFEKLPKLVFTEFDLLSFDNGTNGSGLILEGKGELDKNNFTVRYGTYSPYNPDNLKGLPTPQSFSLLLEPFVIETLPGINLRLPEPITIDIQEVGFVTHDYIDENGKPINKGVFIRAKVSGPGFDLQEVYPIDWPSIIEINEESGQADVDKSENNDTSGEFVASEEPSTDEGLVKWWDINKTLGPANLKQIGLQWKDGKISALVNASISFGGITLSLMGLKATVEANVPPGWPHFGLEGMGLAFASGGVEVAGAFVKEESSQKGITDQYLGAVNIMFEDVLIYGMGAYAKINGHDSVFVYALLDYPIGGPPFFFVEGLALGFGYNRGFIMPQLNKVKEFPLVSQAMSEPKSGDDPADPMAMLQGMDDSLPPMEGEMLLAVGIKFNTFGVLDSFLLLVASFGEHTRFDLLGLSRLTLPPKDDKAPVVFVEIALEASFEPDKGVVQINGLITNNSYVYSKDAHLTGGFAFYTWFKDQKDSKAKAGDFVLSLGGYHPDFKKPDWYPAVPRIALNWQVDKHLDVKGEAYFAMTPRYAMAGYQMTATYDDGALHAVFSEGADFLIQWKPFHYDITAYVNLKASFTAKINLAFTTVHKTFHLNVGADLSMWGPTFGGHAKIHVKVMGVGFSFPIDFGAKKASLPPLTWDEFSESFLPAEDKIISITPTNGLIKTVGNTWVMNPKEFCIRVNSEVPITNVVFDNATQNDLNDWTVEDGQITQHKYNGQITDCEVGVAPMQKKQGKFTSEVKLSINEGDENKNNEIAFSLIPKQMPTALWGEKTSNINADGLVELIGGVELVLAKEPESDSSKSIEQINLVFATSNSEKNHWSYADSSSEDGFAYDTLCTAYLPDYLSENFPQYSEAAKELIASQNLLIETLDTVSLIPIT